MGLFNHDVNIESKHFLTLYNTYLSILIISKYAIHTAYVGSIYVPLHSLKTHYIVFIRPNVVIKRHY
jgi:hypothetical protein